jgi:hypothetical protein
VSKFIKPSSWRKDRKVRILSNAFGLGGKIGIIQHVGATKVYVRIVHSKKPGDHDEVAYPNPTEQLRLI